MLCLMKYSTHDVESEHFQIHQSKLMLRLEENMLCSHPAGVRGVGNLPLTSAFVGPIRPVLTKTLTTIRRAYATTLLARKARLGVVVEVSLSILE